MGPNDMSSSSSGWKTDRRGKSPRELAREKNGPTPLAPIGLPRRGGGEAAVAAAAITGGAAQASRGRLSKEEEEEGAAAAAIGTRESSAAGQIPKGIGAEKNVGQRSDRARQFRQMA